MQVRAAAVGLSNASIIDPVSPRQAPSTGSPTTQHRTRTPRQPKSTMPPSPSPSPPPPPKKKKAFQFKRANLGADTDEPSKSTAGGGELDFFSRGRENYARAAALEKEKTPEVKQESKKKKSKKKSKKNQADGEDSEEDGSPPKRARRRGGGDAGADSGGEPASARRRNAHARERSSHPRAIELSDSDSPQTKAGGGGGGGAKSKSRARDASLTPPPVLYADMAPLPPPPPPRRRRPRSPAPRSTVVPLDDDDDDDDDEVTITNPAAPTDEASALIAALERRARERAAAAAPTSSSSTISPPVPYDPIISILVTSDIDDTRPLVVRRRLNQSLKLVRVTWCERQGFNEEQSKDIFLTWKGNKVFDHSTCRGFGIDLENVESQDGMRDGNVHFVAMTAEMFAEAEKEREMQYLAETQEEVEEPEEEVVTMRLTLKSKGYEDFKLKVRPETQISSIIAVFRQARKIPEERGITLDFDGDTLEPDDTVGDTELEDMFGIDVYIN